MELTFEPIFLSFAGAAAGAMVGAYLALFWTSKAADDAAQAAKPAAWGRRALTDFLDALGIDWREHPVTGAQIEAPASGPVTIHLERVVAQAEQDGIARVLAQAGASRQGFVDAAGTLAHAVRTAVATLEGAEGDVVPAAVVFGEGREGVLGRLRDALTAFQAEGDVQAVFDCYDAQGAFLGTLDAFQPIPNDPEPNTPAADMVAEGGIAEMVAAKSGPAFDMGADATRSGR